MSNYNSVTFAAKRLQAQRNVEHHISSLLYAAAKEIVFLSSIYRTGLKDVAVSGDFTNRATHIVEQTQEKVEAHITQYAIASCKILGIEDDRVREYLQSEVWGKTFKERNREYSKTFAEDIVKMVSAGIQMGYTQSTLLSAVRTGYKNPFATSVITKAQRKGIGIATPSYGRGIYRSAFQNIVRNAQNTIALAWREALADYADKNGSVGFIIHRGSSYPCETCQSQVGYVHPLTDTMAPFHNNCVCITELVFKTEE